MKVQPAARVVQACQSRTGPVVTQTVTQPSACKDRQGASPSVIPTGGGPAGRASRHLEPGMLLHPTHTLQSAAQRWWRLCADAETTTDTTRRAPAAVVGGGVLLVTSTYSASRLFPGPRGATDQADRPTRCASEACHCCQRRTILRLTHEFEAGERDRGALQAADFEISAVDLETDQPARSSGLTAGRRPHRRWTP
jgi:hypothetical protein